MGLSPLLLVLTVLLAPSLSFAQANASVTGKVTDETGGVLPGVTVVLKTADGTQPGVLGHQLPHSRAVAGVQYSKGPCFADQGDFATAGASNINYATELDRSIINVEKGTYGSARGRFAASPKVGVGRLLAAFETSTNSGPWTIPDSYRKRNGVLRYTVGDNLNGMSLTAMGYLSVGF